MIGEIRRGEDKIKGSTAHVRGFGGAVQQPQAECLSEAVDLCERALVAGAGGTSLYQAWPPYIKISSQQKSDLSKRKVQTVPKTPQIIRTHLHAHQVLPDQQQLELPLPEKIAHLAIMAVVTVDDDLPISPRHAELGRRLLLARR